MTKQEAIEFIRNKKLYTNGNNKQVLDKLLSIGAKYAVKNCEVHYLNAPFLFISADGTITHGSDMTTFKSHRYDETSEFDILNIKIDFAYRPFKDSEECFKEMSKHTMFGWVEDAENSNEYTLVTQITSEGLISTGLFISFRTAFEAFKFIDGTPFGIKEN